MSRTTEEVRAAIREELNKPEPLMLTARQAAEALGMSRSSFYQRLDVLTGKFGLIRVKYGRSMRFPRKSVEATADRMAKSRRVVW